MKNLCLYKVLIKLDLKQNIQGGTKISLWIDLEEKCLRNSKIFFLSLIYIITSCQEVGAF